MLPQGHFSERDAAHVMRQLLEFLAFAHDDCNIVHRDIKPENLLLLDHDAPQSQERVARIRAAGGNPAGVEAMCLKVRRGHNRLCFAQRTLCLRVLPDAV
jgi:serine/threonine protein kinase